MNLTVDRPSCKSLFTKRRYAFTTSLEVIKEVLGVPMVAVQAIAHKTGIETSDTRSKCIDENLLRYFTDAFERKTKNYFVNSIRNSTLLSPQELQTFTEFCKTFKKGNVSLGNLRNWNHISKTKLRTYFVNQVKEKTPEYNNHDLDLFIGCGELLCDKIFVSKVKVIPIDNTLALHMAKPCILSKFETQASCEDDTTTLVTNVVNSWQYHSKIRKVKTSLPIEDDIIQQVVLTARYYIYIDDEEDHQGRDNMCYVHIYK